MNAKLSMGTLMVAVATLSMLGCGGAGSGAGASATARVGPAGATLKAGGTTVSIPAGALSDDVQVTVREVEPEHAGRVARVEIEPRGRALAIPGLVSVQVDDRNGRVKMFDDASEHLVEVEVEDRAHHEYKTTIGQLGALEVEIEHLRACSTACGAGEECDDGVCKPHVEDAGAATCEPVCASGLECDDGACKPHGGAGGGGAGDATAAPATCDPGCATGLECDDGVCKPHGNP